MRFAKLSLLAASGCIFAASCSDTEQPALDAAAQDAGAEPSALWDGQRESYDAAAATVARAPVTSELVSARVDSRGMLFAAGEMQISGEPFAEFFAGRNLNYYDRLFLPPDRYIVPDPNADSGLPQDVIVDLFGFSTAVESYEYSKYHMNSIVNFSGAGVSLVNGPNVGALPGATPQDKLAARIGTLLVTAGTDVAGYAQVPAPVGNPLNVLGFAGLMPVLAPYTDFDPTVAATLKTVKSCVVTPGYGGIPSAGNTPEYECDYSTLHVPDAAVSHTISPGVLGLATWKEALWAIDFAGRLHDTGGNPVTTVNDDDLVNVGKPNNVVLGGDPGAVPGTFVGSSALEGMWGLTMLDLIDNVDAWLLRSLVTRDGKALGGFASNLDAITYDFASPLAWFPASIATAVDASVAFPPVTSLSISDARSRASDLAGLLLGNAMFFAMTDPRNPGVGQRLGLKATFDGAPFVADDGAPDGEPSPHDRALALIRVAFVDLERMHSDPSSGAFVDDVTVSGSGEVTQAAAVTTTTISHVLIALRQTLLSLNASVSQYGAADESPSGDALGILNSVPIHPASGGAPAFSSHVRDVFVRNATFLRDVLTTPDGHVAIGADVSTIPPTPSSSAATLEAQAAAVRGLTEAFLLTGDETFRVRARAVSRHLQDAFFSPAALMFRGVEGGADRVSMTPERFAWLQSALRETHKVLFVTGDPQLGRHVLEPMIARVNKLYMNGWDDLDGDQNVNPTTECLAARLQQAEQSLTGETGRDSQFNPVADRDQDCVIEVAHAQRLSVFAGEVSFHSP